MYAERRPQTVEIGSKIKRRRIKLNLTQEELAARTELSKGFISQLERDLTSPSIATLMDILEVLGTDLAEFFSEKEDEKVVFCMDDVFVKDDEENGHSICWLIPNAQKNALEPILVTLKSSGQTQEDDPHEGEEFGYVLTGGITLVIGDRKYRVKKGESFCFKPLSVHYVKNTGKTEAKLLWVATPPSF
jgi:transcriptional regulator with XRE-family HTH domain